MARKRFLLEGGKGDAAQKAFAKVPSVKNAKESGFLGGGGENNAGYGIRGYGQGAKPRGGGENQFAGGEKCQIQ